MIIVPIIPRQRTPKKYVERKCSKTEIISIEFGVICKITFDDFYERGYATNDLLTYIANEKFIPSEAFGFRITIEMSGDEYERLKSEFKGSFDNHLIEIAKQKAEYAKAKENILSKQNPERKYKIEHWIEPFPKEENSYREWTEYVAVY